MIETRIRQRKAKASGLKPRVRTARTIASAVRLDWSARRTPSIVATATE